METISKTQITQDLAAKKLKITRDFDAPPEKVWKAWTTPELLDQWWAPKPYRAETRSMDFREGGTWHYFMVGPDGSRQGCRADFGTIIPNNSFTVTEGFTDENGTLNREFPVMHWHCDFKPAGNGTTVHVVVTFDSEEDLKKIVEMGFKEGFTAAHGNLDELLSR
jgi:uncharacterized protein YndB with AHSA1/START domain